MENHPFLKLLLRILFFVKMLKSRVFPGRVVSLLPRRNLMYGSEVPQESCTKNIHVWHIFCMTIAFPIPPIDNIQSLYHCLIYKYIQYYSNSCKHINAFLIKVFVIISRNLGKSVIYFCGFFRKRTIKKENQSFWSNKKNLTGDLSTY